MDGTMAVAQRMTVAEFFDLPDERWATLVEGEVVVTRPAIDPPRSSPGTCYFALELHGAERRAGSRASPRCHSESCSTITTTTSPTSCGSAPDESLVAREASLQPLPDIAVEIRSPSTWRFDIGPKKRRYEQHGLPELWLVDLDADVVLMFRRSTPAAPSSTSASSSRAATR